MKRWRRNKSRIISDKILYFYLEWIPNEKEYDKFIFGDWKELSMKSCRNVQEGDKDVYVIEWKIKCKNCFDMKLIGNGNFEYEILKLFVHKM